MLSWATTTRRVSEKLEYQRGMALGTAFQGFAHYMLSDFPTALPLLESALVKAENLDDPLIKGRIYGAMAGLHISMGNFKTAIDCGYKSLILIQTSGDKGQEAWTLYGFGTGFFDMGVLDQARDYYQQSLALFEENDDSVGKARSLNGLGSVLQQESKFEEALPYHESSLELFRTAQNPIGEARAINDIGMVYLHLGEYALARSLLFESLRIREQVGNRQSQSTSWMNLGTLSLAEGHVDEAVRQLEKALDIAEAVNARQRVYQIHELLSETYERLGSAEKALVHYKAFHERSRTSVE